MTSLSCEEEPQLADSLQLETSSCLGSLNDSQACASLVLGELTPGRVGCWSLRDSEREFRELMSWDGSAFELANRDAAARFPFREGDEVSMSLLVFNTPIDTDRCEQLEIDAACASISGCRASLHRDAITLRVNTWLGFRDPSGLCQASVTVSDPTSRCAPPPEMSDECQREREAGRDVEVVEERCGGGDEDCDGLVDEGLSCGLSQGCVEGSIRRCESSCGQGVETCVLGAYADCNAPLPEAERCDAVDNDCDGSVDEDTERGEACSLTSPGCAGEFPGVYACNAVGAVCEPSVPFGLDEVEVCDGLDNNCDGEIDNPVRLGEECSLEVEVEPGELCAYPATYQCPEAPTRGVASELICEGAPPPERCNGGDDDCDGLVDEGLEGLEELCDGVDNNCDGEVDEGGVCGQLIYNHCAVSFGWAYSPELDINALVGYTAARLPPLEVPESCGMYDNLDAEDFACDTASARSGFRVVHTPRRLSASEWIGVAWDCDLSDEPDSSGQLNLPPPHLEVLTWARERCGVSLGYRDYGSRNDFDRLTPRLCPPISPLPFSRGTPRCVRTSTPRRYAMINIESALWSGDMLAIGFDCAADSPEETERALKIQSEFQVLFGTYHNNNNLPSPNDGDLEWGGLLGEDISRSGNHRGVISSADGRLRPFDMYWTVNQHVFGVATHAEGVSVLGDQP